MFRAKILADTINPMGHRLTTFELTFPQCILAEFNTHRMISKNAASMRAIPVSKMIEAVESDPFIPEFGYNEKGMQSTQRLSDMHRGHAKYIWNKAMRDTIAQAKVLDKLGVHKQFVNRLLSPWAWTTVIASATDWVNFFHLRCSESAEPSMKRIADMALELYTHSKPDKSTRHTPMVTYAEFQALGFDRAVKVAVGRCARVSYLTHDGKRDYAADIGLHDRLANDGHWSPFEHVAVASGSDDYTGNFRGWVQYRKTFANENVVQLARKTQ